MIKQKSVMVVIIFVQSVFFSATNAYIHGAKITADAESIVAAISKQTKFDYHDIIRTSAILDNIQLIVEHGDEFPELIKPFEELLSFLYAITKSDKKPVTKNDALHMHEALSRFRFRVLAPARSKSDTTLSFSSRYSNDTSTNNPKASDFPEKESSAKTIAIINLLDEVCNDLLIMTEPAHIKPITFKDFIKEHTVATTCVAASGIALLSALTTAFYRYFDSKAAKEKLTKIVNENQACMYLPKDTFDKVLSQFSTSLDSFVVNQKNQFINTEKQYVDIQKILTHFQNHWAIVGESRNVLITLLNQIQEIEQANRQNPAGIKHYFLPSLDAAS